MIRIKHESNYQCHCDGFCLYLDGRKVHVGYFVSIAALREMWAKYRQLLCAGYSLDVAQISLN